MPTRPNTKGELGYAQPQTIRSDPRPRPTPEIEFSWGPLSVGWNELPGFPWNADEPLPGAPDQPTINLTPGNSEITFEADARVPEGDFIIDYEWDFGDGTKGYGSTVTHTYLTASPSTRTVLCVTDNHGRRFCRGRQMNLRKTDLTLIHPGITIEGSLENPEEPIPTRPMRMIYMGSGWDPLITSGNQAAFEEAADLIVGFPGPQWDTFKNWDIDEKLSYINLFSEPDADYLVYQLDAGGEELWMPYPTGGPYVRRSIDLRSTSYRTGWINEAKERLANGATGIYIDDVNFDVAAMFRRADGSAPTTDFTAASYYSSDTGNGWPALVADFLHDVIDQIHEDYPNAKFALNTQVFWLEPERWTDERALHAIDAGDWVMLEHGFVDAGLNNDPGTDTGVNYSLRSVHKFLDAVHARGTAFMTLGAASTADERRYEVANYLYARDFTQPDMIGLPVGDLSFDTVYQTDFGTRLARADANVTGGMIIGDFEDGYVTIEPDNYAPTVISDGTYDGDLAYGRQATASSVEGDLEVLSAGKAVDGNPGTRWASEYSDGEWWQVDLGVARDINEVAITWEPAYASEYEVQTSLDGSTWTTRATETISDPGEHITTFATGSARYVRIQGIARATVYGISIYTVTVTLGAGGPSALTNYDDTTVYDETTEYNA